MEYKIIFVYPSSKALQQALNEYAAKGWKLSGFPPPLPGDTYDSHIPADFLKVLLERVI